MCTVRGTEVVAPHGIPVDLLDRLLLVEPAQRATMEDTLSHPWVTGQKAPTPDYYDDDQLRFRGGIDLVMAGCSRRRSSRPRSACEKMVLLLLMRLSNLEACAQRR